MKPWPPELAKLYPPQRRPMERAPGLDEPHLLRPWWRKRPTTHGGTYFRQDMQAEVWRETLTYSWGPPGHRLRFRSPGAPDMQTAALGAVADDVMAEIDAKWPIPRPPFRVGQVWASVYSGANEGVAVQIIGRGYHVPPRDTANAHYDWSFSSSDVMGIAGAYLVHDPCVPDAAPWAPAEAA